MSGFKKATKAQARLRLALFGPSGSGKTFTALSIAKGMGKKIAGIDSERGSMSKYSDRFEFDVLELEDKSIDGYVAAIEMAEKEAYEILIIDSMSHAWMELLEEIDKLAKAKFKGNTWSAWSEGTPKQKKLVSAILDYSGHIIATMRSKTEWTLSDDGKNRPNRVGLSPEQGKGIEYEFDVLMEISSEHIGNVIKDRTGKFQDQLITKPGEKFGGEMIEWLSTGTPMEIKPKNNPAEKEKIQLSAKKLKELQDNLSKLDLEKFDQAKFESMEMKWDSWQDKLTAGDFEAGQREFKKIRQDRLKETPVHPEKNEFQPISSGEELPEDHPFFKMSLEEKRRVTPAGHRAVKLTQDNKWYMLPEEAA